MEEIMNKIIYSVMCLLVLSTLVMPMVTGAPDGGKDPKDMIGGLREWASEFFIEFILLMCVIVAIIVAAGVASSQLKAKGIAAIGIILGAIFIFYGLPWLATNLF